MPVSGLLALLDDVANVLDDVSTMSQLAAEKTAKIAEDDLGSAIEKKAGKLDPKHEIAVVLAVAKGSLRNKLLYVIPGTFAIAVFAPALITPLCLGSGAYICFEGAKKLLDKKNPEKTAARRQELMAAVQGGKEPLLRYEKERIAQAIKTDAALSLELAGVQLGLVAAAPLLTKLAVLGVASVGATALLYTTIIGIIKVDDLALHLAERPGDKWHDKAQRALGRGLLRGASPVMKTISAVGMAALFYMGGHLLISKIPGAEDGFALLAERLSHSPLVDKLVELSAVAATGVAGGVATLGVVKTIEKPIAALKEAASRIYAQKLSRPATTVKRALWHTADFFYPMPGEAPALPPPISPTAPRDEAPSIGGTPPLRKEFAAVTQPLPEQSNVPAPMGLKIAFAKIAADGDSCALPKPAAAVPTPAPPTL